MEAAVIKDSLYGQICTFNLPAFALMKRHKRLLRKLEAAFNKSEEPRDSASPFEYIERFDKEDSIAVYCINARTIVALGNVTTPSKDLANACELLNEFVGEDEERYFITHYT